MAEKLVTASVSLTSRFPFARAVMHEAAARALAATGRKIAERTAESMTPGYFLDSGLSQETTTYEQLTPTSGQVHIPTTYAGDVEYGTVRMPAKPVLRPAIARIWPGTLYGHWGRAMAGLNNAGRQVLPVLDPPGPPGPPIERVGGSGAP